jgi:hypothetical protein
MKEYKFTRKAIYIEFGVVTANDEKEAIQKIKDNDYDDIIDTYLDEEDNSTIELEGVENENN